MHGSQVDNGTQLAFPHAKAVVQRRVALAASPSSYDTEDVVCEVHLPGEARTHLCSGCGARCRQNKPDTGTVKRDQADTCMCLQAMSPCSHVPREEVQARRLSAKHAP